MMICSVAGTMAMSWEEIRDTAVLADELGFDTFYAAEHLMGVAGFAEEEGVLDALVLLGALAPVTRRIRLGAMVSPVTFRNPPMLARAIAALDSISGGRAVFGLGAGWSAEEHEAFGLPFPAVGRRLELLEAACRMIRTLWEAEDLVDLDGDFPLHRAGLRPRPPQRAVPLLVAGASNRTVGIAARWAALYNCVGSPAYLADRTALLRRREAEAGRPEGSVEVTAHVQFEVIDDPDEAEARREALRRRALTSRRAQQRSWVEGEDPSSAFYVGPLEGLRDHLAAYEKVGVRRVDLALPRPPEALPRLAEVVLG